MRRRGLVLMLLLAACSGGDRSPAQVLTSSPLPTTAAPTIAVPAPMASSSTTARTAPTVVEVSLRVESRVDAVGTGDLARAVEATLHDPRGWAQAGITFVLDERASTIVVLATPAEVDELCAPLLTRGEVSCQNGPVVALNVERWLSATGEWDGTIDEYRAYVVNHEVGHLVGQRHPEPRCPEAGRPAAVMAQQTNGLLGCTGNPWPQAWELELARQRPLQLAPAPSWSPGPPPTNRGADS